MGSSTDPQPRPPTPPTPNGLVTVVWDDQNPDYNFMSRTRKADYQGPPAPPAVNRFMPYIIPNPDRMGDYRVNMADPYNWKPAIVDVNGGDVHKWEYLVDRERAIYNNGTQGWPMQMYLVFSGNKLQGEYVGDWFRFQTLKPADLAKVKGMTIETHSHLVHRFACIAWDGINDRTKRIASTNTARGQVYMFVVTREGTGYIPRKHVVPG
jgi:hypothetical protein